ncbi:DUF6931 family protein [Aquabacter spiritensis]|uniref:Uncharacterized protein n=1 Tax=Aquabacter spiritensis TaxID=933073 RepID=A0A4R3LS86_9HYPH|nr:hypothetical protein [Aquabacter spiritensis]TCT02469.1 hypothetical protein EDC64_113120 [Aquabacter spiritensis]
MEVGFLPKVRFALAEHLCTLLEPSDEAAGVLKPGMTAADFIGALAAQDQTIDAIRYLAVGLPRREAVWWACMSRRRFLEEELPPSELAAWAAAETWVYEPTEPHRRAAHAPADALKFQTAGAYAALGVFWSGGSLAPPEVSIVVPPGDALTGSAVAASVILCCVPGPAKTIGERHRAALAIGIDIANGGSGRPVQEQIHA